MPELSVCHCVDFHFWKQFCFGPRPSSSLFIIGEFIFENISTKNKVGSDEEQHSGDGKMKRETALSDERAFTWTELIGDHSGNKQLLTWSTGFVFNIYM